MISIRKAVSHKSKSDFSKSCRYFFILMHIIYNLDFGFIERRTPRSKLFIRIITLTKIIVEVSFYCVLLFAEIFDPFIIAWNVHCLIVKVYVVIYLLFSKYTSFCGLKSALFLVDSMTNNYLNIGAKLILAVIASHTYGFGTSVLHCMWFSNECHGSFMLKFCTIMTLNSVNTVFIMCFFVFHSVYCRLRILVEKVNGGGLVLESLDIYKRLLDALDKVKKLYCHLYAVTLAFQMPVLVMTAYAYLQKVASHETMYLDVGRLLNPIHVVCLLFAPAISAGLVTSKADELKLILEDRLLTERNEPEAGSIELFLDYMHGRPMRFTVFKIIPLDWTLPINTVNLCITYQIAIVQLTHLF